MVDPILVAAGIAAMQKAIEIGMDRLAGAFSAPPPPQVILTPAPKPVIRRHDYSDGYGALSDANITVAHHLSGVYRAPTFLILEKFNHPGDGFVVPMIQGETAFLTVSRDHYSIAALIVDLPRTRGAKPTLRGLGASDEFIASNTPTALHIPTEHPTQNLVRQVGLLDSTGNLPFLLPPPPAPRALPATTLARSLPPAAPFLTTAANRQYHCDVCFKKFPTRVAVNNHKRNAHSSAWERFVDWLDDL
ncbi:hypothetical protein ACWELJ_19790 [Nocardia sp. NPDC004582]